MISLIKKKSIITILIMIALLSSISVTTNASGEGLTDWKKDYYNFMTDYTRLYPDMNSEIMKLDIFGNPDFINGEKTDNEMLQPLYHKTERLKLLNITGNTIPEIVVSNYGNFSGDWVGSVTNDTNTQIYKHEDGKLRKIFETSENLLELYYKQVGGNVDLILKPGYPQYVDDSGDGPEISNLVWNEQNQKLENIVNEELTDVFYSSIEGRSNPNYLPKYFEDRGYSWLRYLDQETNTITIQEEEILIEGDITRCHYIEYLSESEIRNMLDEYPDTQEPNDIEDKVTEEASTEDNKVITEKPLEENTKEGVLSSVWSRLTSFLRSFILDPLVSLFNGDNDRIIDEEISNIQGEKLELEDEEVVKDLDSDYESSKEGFRTYANNKFGFTIDYPSSFKKDASSNEDFVKFNSEDEKANLTAMGEENISGESVSELYKKDIDYIENMTNIAYKASSDNWYVISWSHNDLVFYKRVYVDDEIITTMEMTSPKSEGSIYNPFVDHISLAFKPGNLLDSSIDSNKDKKVETNKNVKDKSIDLSEVKLEIQKILDESLGTRGVNINTPVSEQDILRHFSVYLSSIKSQEKVDFIDHYNEGDTSWDVISKESVDEYSRKYFGKEIIADNHKQKREVDGGWLEYYYKDQKYYFGFNPVSMRPETSFIVKEIVEINENMINCKIDSVINDGMGERVDGTYSIDLERKDNRYIIKNIKE